MTKSVEPENQDATFCSSKYLPTQEDEDESLSLSLKEYNDTLNGKLQLVYAKIRGLNSEIVQLREEKGRLCRNNRKK